MRTGRLLFGVWLLVATHVFAQDDAAALQKQGIARIESYREKFQKTGDRTSLLPQLDLAAQELEASRAQFARRGEEADAARSAIELGEARRLREAWAAARGAYAEGGARARKAGDGGLQARAHLGLGRVELNTGK